METTIAGQEPARRTEEVRCACGSTRFQEAWLRPVTASVTLERRDGKLIAAGEADYNNQRDCTDGASASWVECASCCRPLEVDGYPTRAEVLGELGEAERRTGPRWKAEYLGSTGAVEEVVVQGPPTRARAITAAARQVGVHRDLVVSCVNLNPGSGGGSKRG
jgi:hypothetical protein